MGFETLNLNKERERETLEDLERETLGVSGPEMGKLKFVS